MAVASPAAHAGRSVPLLRDPRSKVPALKRAGALSLVNVRTVTGAAGLLPNVLIVGAQRSGTTSMVRALRQHPALFTAVLNQEVHFFDDSYDRGIAWYRSHFPFRSFAALAARKIPAAPMVFESSPYYMFHPLAPARIAADLPGVKLLVMLRDPAERAYSAHAHETYLGHETESFGRALELEPARLAGEAERIAAQPGYVSYNHRHYAYRTRGHYAEQLERLERVFGRDRLHIIDSGSFFADPTPVWESLLAFLGLPAGSPPKFLRYNARTRQPIDDQIRASLRDYYQPHDERLADWLGQPPSWRR